MKPVVTLISLVLLSVGFALWIKQPILHVPTPVALTDKASPSKLEAHVKMLSEVFVPRDATHIENLNKVAAYIEAEFLKSSGQVSIKTYTAANNQNYKNVHLRFGPSSGERIIIGAHYDAYGVFPAADDNASGVAGILELARMLDGIVLSLPIELVAYTLEEPPFFRSGEMGSQIHAKALSREDVAVKAMLSLEMIGYFTSAANSQEYPLSLLKWLYPNQGDFIAVIGNFVGGSLVREVKQAFLARGELAVHSINAPRWVAGIDFSDHASFWDEGYPAVMVSDTAFYRNFAYHTENDTADRLDYDKMAHVVDGVMQYILTQAGQSH